MIIWPTSLQQEANYDYNETWSDGTIRSQPDEGPIMTRRRYTKIRKFAKMSIWVDRDQYNIFVNFYTNNILGGSLPFVWKDPITETSSQMLFLKPPSFSAIGPNNFKIDCELEVYK
jgi:hypothetical protein